MSPRTPVQLPEEKAKPYDPNEVQAYMKAKEKEKKKKDLERKEAEKLATEKKHKQLEDLAQKSKNIAVSSSRSRKHEDDDKPRASGGSDKENQDSCDLSSSDASTITGASDPSDQQLDEDIDSVVNRYADPVPTTSAYYKPLANKDTKDSGIGTGEDLITRLMSGTADDITAKFSNRAQAIKMLNGQTPAAQASRPISSLPASLPVTERDALGYPKRPYTSSAATRVGSESQTQSGFRDKNSRIQNIMNFSNSLHQNVKWAHPVEDLAPRQPYVHKYESQPRCQTSDEGYVSKYTRMTVDQDYTVFDTDLPGVGGLQKVAHDVQMERDKNYAAAKIQAAYKGHAVRQAMHEEVSLQYSSLTYNNIIYN